jgi:hypothetical protein
VQTELKISALIETGGEEKTMRDTHLSKDRNSGTGNKTKERRHDPRQPENLAARYGHEQENQRPQRQIQTPADNTGAQTETYPTFFF